MNRAQGFVWASVLSALSGCNEVRFVHEAEFDFDRYPTAYVEPLTAPPPTDELATTPSAVWRDFIDDLRRGSDFERITLPPDPRGDAAVTLRVVVEGYEFDHVSSSSTGCSCGKTTAKLDGVVAVEDRDGYVVEGHWLEGNGSEEDCGAVVVVCIVPDVTQESYDAALVDLLDQVTALFLGDYDI